MLHFKHTYRMLVTKHYKHGHTKHYCILNTLTLYNALKTDQTDGVALRY